MMTYRMVKAWFDKVTEGWEELSGTKEGRHLKAILDAKEAEGLLDDQVPEVAEAMEAFQEAAHRVVFGPVPRPYAGGCLDPG
jgi:hypothetical protein